MPSSCHPDAHALVRRIRPQRTIDGCSAVLLPFEATSRIDWDSFAHLLARTAEAGLTPAVNMDTGYGPHLTPATRTEVLLFTRRTLGPAARFIAGAGPFGVGGDELAAYRASVEEICGQDATPIIFPSAWLSAHEGSALAQTYRDIIGDAPAALGFELGSMFAAFGRIYTLDEYRRLLDVEPMVGAKHSSLDRYEELARLELRDAHRPEFKVYTGNDLAIDMVMYGSDYLLGLSAFDPVAFARRDAWWAEGDGRFLALNDALQALGVVAFRPPVPAYKASAAHYLARAGHIRSAVVPTGCPTRPDGEDELLASFADRIEQVMQAPAPA